MILVNKYINIIRKIEWYIRSLSKILVKISKAVFETSKGVHNSVAHTNNYKKKQYLL